MTKNRSMHISYRLLLSALSFMISVIAAAINGMAETQDSQRQALEVIISTADRICITVSDNGQAPSSDIQREVRLQLEDLASKLAGVAVAGTGGVSSGHYQDVLRDQLAATLNNNAQCELEVYRSLSALLLPRAPLPEAKFV